MEPTVRPGQTLAEGEHHESGYGVLQEFSPGDGCEIVRELDRAACPVEGDLDAVRRD